MRGEEGYESLREVEFGISQKGNTRNGRQQMPSCLSLILQNKKKTLAVSYSIFTEQWVVQLSLGGQGPSFHDLRPRIPEHGRSWGR
jgi:hypothetical protein